MKIAAAFREASEPGYRTAAIIALVLVLAACGLQDESAYQTYVVCNQQIATADNDKALLGCFTEEKRAAILAEHSGDTPEVWREQLRNRRPHEPKLFREMVADNGDSATLLMYSGTGVYLARHTAELKPERWSWKIADENTQGLSPGFNDRLDAPASVSLEFSGAVEWAGGDALTVQAPVRPYCNLQIRHVYDHAIVQMQIDCDKPGQPGEHTVADIRHPEASRPFYVQAPDGGRIDPVESAARLPSNRSTTTVSQHRSSSPSKACKGPTRSEVVSKIFRSPNRQSNFHRR